jgi:hypothetical protein
MTQRIVISESIDDLEVLIRGILTPFHYSRSKNKPKREAFLPPPRSNEVSVLRLQFTTIDFCKKHAQTIQMKDNEYIGLIAVQVLSIKESNQEDALYQVSVMFSPLDEHQNRITEKVFTDTLGLPMHADIVYSFETIEGKTLPQEIRKLADLIVKRAKCYIDTKPEELLWHGENISF